jgi:hypothetical protein
MVFSKPTIDVNNSVLVLTEPAIIISNETRDMLMSRVNDERQVIVHCRIFNRYPWGYARIWKTTYLIDKESNDKSCLLHVDGISIYPLSTDIPTGTALHFTLIFSSLPNSCLVFDFFEQTTCETGFYIPAIKRNQTDVYSIDLSD